ncbi:TetR/AcrR family transcriptional regulator [Streptomyces sp. NPDC087440]|uniref:TetR/AcrR family transcriptional regulator n=1 Tax=Streptomyces sp. NPDC087440 TaxID=3365790 RepID=UPI0037FC3842
MSAEPLDRTGAAATRVRRDILVAARSAFHQLGSAAGIVDIAKIAGLGPAALHRQFPTREALIEALVEDFHTHLIGLAERATAAPADRALEEFLRGAGWRIATSHGFLPRTWGEQARPAQIRRLAALTEDLVRLSRQSGAVRDDLTTGDVLAAVSALRGVIEGAPANGSAEPWLRHVDIVLAGMRRAAPATTGNFPRPLAGPSGNDPSGSKGKEATTPGAPSPRTP